MSDPKKPVTDDDFERDLAALSRAYGPARREEPASATDDAIRAAARRAVQAGPQAKRRIWVTQWATPVATAAVVMLTVSIGLVSYRERPDLATTEMRSEADARPQAPATTSSQVPEPAATPPIPASAPPPAAPKPFSEAATAKSKLRAQVPAAAREEAPRERAAEAKVKENFAPDPEPAPAAVPVAPAAKDSATLEKRSFAAPAPASPALQAAPAAAPPARSEMQSGERAAPAAAAGAIAPRAKVEKADRTPEAWLKEITELKRDGKLKEALEELEKFRKRFPDYVLPQELKDLR